VSGAGAWCRTQDSDDPYATLPRTSQRVHLPPRYYVMQQKRSEVMEVESLRVQMSTMMRLLSQFDQHYSERDQLPPSYAHALIVLLTFHRQQQQPTLTELVELLNIDKSNVTRLCQRMVEEGHVLISRDGKDKRAKRIQLSAKGIVMAEEVNRISLDRFTQLSEAMGGLEAVAALCERFNEALDGLVSQR
jgi:DNA-binding MarR family transcriptional regulator